jgi:hypothetical protein
MVRETVLSWKGAHRGANIGKDIVEPVIIDAPLGWDLFCDMVIAAL